MISWRYPGHTLKKRGGQGIFCLFLEREVNAANNYCVKNFKWKFPAVFFVSWIREKLVRALKFMEDRTKNIFLIFSFSWFLTMVLFNVQFTYPQNRILKVICLLVMALNVTLNFIIIYYLVINYICLFEYLFISS